MYIDECLDSDLLQGQERTHRLLRLLALSKQDTLRENKGNVRLTRENRSR
jgi:hypothetical protein